MTKLWKMATLVLSILACTLGSLNVLASGVFIVSRAGVPAYKDAEAGFMQMAYSLGIQGFDPATIKLKGASEDDAALAALKAKNPSLVYAVGGYAAKKVRQAMPNVWIVYAMVYYPEAMGFGSDPKMVGIPSLGSAKALLSAAKAFNRRAKSIVVIHAKATQPSMSAILGKLNGAGFNAEGRSVADVGSLRSLFDSIRGEFRAVLVLPDPVTSNPDALRFLISQCVDSKMLPLSLTESMVSSGALCAAFFPPDAVGNQAGKVAKSILSTGAAPSGNDLVPSRSSIAVNNRTAQALRMKVPSTLRVEVTYE